MQRHPSYPAQPTYSSYPPHPAQPSTETPEAARRSPLMLREYGCLQECERHAASLAGDGWRIVSIVEQECLDAGPPPFGRLLARLRLARPALLVTYAAA